MKFHNPLPLLKETFTEWKEDDALQLGASLAYYTIFSLAPLLLVAISVAGLVFGREAAQGQIVGQIQGLVGRQAGEAVQTMIVNANRQGSGVLGTIIGIGAILFGATGAFAQLQSSLNKIWEVKPREGRGVLGMLHDRLLSFGMVLAIGFLLLVSLVVSAALASLGSFTTGLGPGMEAVLGAVHFVVSLGVIVLLFTLMFRYLPDVHIAWRDAWVGATVTALLFVIGKFLIGFYLGNSAVGSTYGAAGSLVILLLWIYYASQILFFGAELTQVYARRYGSRIEPDKDAVRVEEVKVDPEEAERMRREGKADPQKKTGAPERPRPVRQRTGT